MSVDLTFTTLISIAGGVMGIILALITIGSWVKRALMKEAVQIKSEICRDICSVKEEISEINTNIKEIRNDGRETLAKLNEHLVVAEQGISALAHLKEKVSSLEEELDSSHNRIKR